MTIHDPKPEEAEAPAEDTAADEATEDTEEASEAQETIAGEPPTQPDEDARPPGE